MTEKIKNEFWVRVCFRYQLSESVELTKVTVTLKASFCDDAGQLIRRIMVPKYFLAFCFCSSTFFKFVYRDLNSGRGISQYGGRKRTKMQSVKRTFSEMGTNRGESAALARRMTWANHFFFQKVWKDKSWIFYMKLRKWFR